MDKSEKYRFIPIRKRDLVQLIEDNGLPEGCSQHSFMAFCQLLESVYHFQFQQDLEILKDRYFYINPDVDTLKVMTPDKMELEQRERELVEQFRKILNDANFEQISRDQIEFALQHDTLIKLSLAIDFDEYEQLLLFWRGDNIRREIVRDRFYRRREIDVPYFERVVMLIKFKDAKWFAQQHNKKEIAFQPGSMIIKLFRNIPKADLETLFPNARIGMTIQDKLLIGGGVIGGGIGVFLKAGAGLLTMTAVLWVILQSFYSQGDVPEVSSKQLTAMVGGMSALWLIGLFVWKQWNNYKNLRIRFMKKLSDNLYFKTLDSNAGVFHRIIDAAEEEEFKEALLAYYFLANSDRPLSAGELDAVVEAWFSGQHKIEVDFEIQDALEKLMHLGLCKANSLNGIDHYEAPALDEACRRLDEKWDGYFEYR